MECSGCVKLAHIREQHQYILSATSLFMINTQFLAHSEQSVLLHTEQILNRTFVVL